MGAFMAIWKSKFIQTQSCNVGLLTNFYYFTMCACVCILPYTYVNVSAVCVWSTGYGKTTFHTPKCYEEEIFYNCTPSCYQENLSTHIFPYIVCVCLHTHLKTPMSLPQHHCFLKPWFCLQNIFLTEILRFWYCYQMHSRKLGSNYKTLESECYLCRFF